MDLLKRTWAEISLDSIEHNYNELRQRAGDSCRFLAMVKADAYGHGAVPVARFLMELGAEMASVSNLEEAVQLRRGGIKSPILILGYTPPEFADALCQYGITQEIHSLDYARQLNSQLKGSANRLTVHVKLDTGMSRLGFSCGEGLAAAQEVYQVSKLDKLRVEGIFTHFATADETDDTHTKRQHTLFLNTLRELEARGLSFEIRHCSNSAAAIVRPEYCMDMIRPGIATYGLYPSENQRGAIDLRPAMSLRSVISQVKTIEAGTGVSYGRTAVPDERRTIAVAAAGYADGLPRIMSNRMQALVRGKRVKQIGRICMDMCMLDITDVPEAAAGDTVTFIGRDGAENLPMDIWAEQTNTITYEIACGISKRVARLFYMNQILVDTMRYIV